ncbi:MAG: hypothetical protein K2U26_08200 [Cyclobacteriaceae bacterium]|nr:hypothetical protein [Cyclobacteriaceae bacterium]
MKNGFFSDVGEKATARISLSSNEAWKIFTKGLPFEKALASAKLDGDIILAEAALRMVTVMA